MHFAEGLVRQAGGDLGLSGLLRCHFPSSLDLLFCLKTSDWGWQRRYNPGVMEEIQLSRVFLRKELIFIFIRLKYIFLNYFPLMIIR